MPRFAQSISLGRFLVWLTPLGVALASGANMVLWSKEPGASGVSWAVAWFALNLVVVIGFGLLDSYLRRKNRELGIRSHTKHVGRFALIQIFGVPSLLLVIGATLSCLLEALT